jgi:chromosome segregation ATPase
MAEETVNQHGNDLTAQVQELQAALAQRDSEMAALKESTRGMEEKLAASGAALADAVGQYRALVLQANPGIADELIAGENIAAVNESLAKAKSLVGKVRKSVEKEISRSRVPIGSPGRTAPDLSALTPREKINYGIGGKR